MPAVAASSVRGSRICSRIFCAAVFVFARSCLKSRFVAPSAMERAAVSKRIIVSRVNLVAVFILGVCYCGDAVWVGALVCGAGMLLSRRICSTCFSARVILGPGREIMSAFIV